MDHHTRQRTRYGGAMGSSGRRRRRVQSKTDIGELVEETPIGVLESLEDEEES